MKKVISARVKSLPEILQSDEIIEVTSNYVAFKNGGSWKFGVNEYIGETIVLDGEICRFDYAYRNGSDYFKKEWLEDIKEEIFFEKGDRVLVRDDEGQGWKRAYYSHFEYDLHYCYKHCKDEWTSKGETHTWSYVKLWEENDEL